VKRVLVIASNTCQDPYPVYPLGASVVAGALRRAGYLTRVLDLLLTDSPEEISRLVKEFQPNFIGVSVRNVDNVDSLTAEASWTGDALRTLVAGLKDVSHAPIILGGPGFSLMPEELLDHTGADYGVAGPGEVALPELLALLSSGKTPPHIVADPASSRSDIAQAAWDDAVFPEYLKRGGVPGLHTKRGCPNACLYCCYPKVEGTRIRHRDPREVVEEMRSARDRFGAREFFFTDAVFNDAEGQYLRLAEILAGADLGVGFSAYFQPLRLTHGEMTLLRRAGLKAIEAGTDGCCDRMLGSLRKPHRMRDVFAFQELCHTHRMPCAHFVTFGGPGETMDTLDEGLENLDRLAGGCVFAFLGLRIYQGTGLYRLAVNEGLIDNDAPLLKPTFYFSPDLDPAAIEDRLRRAFAGRRDRFFPPEEGNLRMRILRRMGHSGLLWDTLPAFASYKQGGTPA
jgi:lipid biosynthesis B12-binding/radical SAM protein